MRGRIIRLGWIGVLVGVLWVWPQPLGAADKPLTIRLGTLAPRGTSYHKSLQLMGEKWRTVSSGNIKLVIYPDGTQGGESDMVGLMQTGNLDAGLLTAVGLSEIEPAVNALQNMPMAF